MTGANVTLQASQQSTQIYFCKEIRAWREIAIQVLFRLNTGRAFVAVQKAFTKM